MVNFMALKEQRQMKMAVAQIQDMGAIKLYPLQQHRRTCAEGFTSATGVQMVARHVSMHWSEALALGRETRDMDIVWHS